MRTIALLAAAAVAAVAAGQAAAQVERTPKLRVVAAAPLVVAGSDFAAGERVTVTAVTLLGPRIRRTTATSAGTFRVRFAGVTQPCGKPLAIRARGAAGSIATMRLKAPPCVPPPVD